MHLNQPRLHQLAQLGPENWMRKVMAHNSGALALFQHAPHFRIQQNLSQLERATASESTAAVAVAAAAAHLCVLKHTLHIVISASNGFLHSMILCALLLHLTQLHEVSAGDTHMRTRAYLFEMPSQCLHQRLQERSELRITLQTACRCHSNEGGGGGEGAGRGEARIASGAQQTQRSSAAKPIANQRAPSQASAALLSRWPARSQDLAAALA